MRQSRLATVVALPDRAIGACVDLFTRLAARPGLLLAVCFALNAVFLPYAGLYHDARLYAAQVYQAETGQLAADLFFKYGSQSQYTLFPELLAAPARCVGLEVTLFATYFLSNAARLWAIQRLTLRLFGPTPAAAAGLILAAIAPVWWGWAGGFCLNEWYFTARVPALALSVLAMERVLAGRRWVAAGLLMASAVIHPLMTAPAVAIVGGWIVWDWAKTPLRQTALVGLGLVFTTILGAYLFKTVGSLDRDWRNLSLSISPHISPLNWRFTDYLRIGLAVGGVLTLRSWSADTSLRRWWALILLTAVAGLAAGLVTALGSWALPFQVQPVRAVWPLEMMRLPAVFTVVARLWCGGATGRLGAVTLFLLLVAGADLTQPTAALIFATTTVVGLGVARWSTPTDDSWLWRGLIIGLATWAAVWYGGIVPLRVADLLVSDDLRWLGLGERAEHVLWPFGVLARLAVGLLVVGAVGYVIVGSTVRIATAVGVGLAATIATFVIPQLNWTTERSDPRIHDVRFVAEHLPRTGDQPATVYWPGAPLEQLWFNLRVNSYFHRVQLSGNLFSRATASEGWRRTVVAAPFEIDRFRREFPRHPELAGEDLGELIHLPPPTVEQFWALVRDPEVDIAVLPYDFGGAVATNGRVWIYDCRTLRTQLRDSHPLRLPAPAREPH